MLTVDDSFFDVTWEGPVLDTNGRPTAQVKSEYHLPRHFIKSTIEYQKIIIIINLIHLISVITVYESL